MQSGRIKRKIEKNKNEILGILLRKYPSYVLSKANRDEIPVFAFHGVSYGFIKECLEYISANEYETMLMNQYVQMLGDKKKKKYILITFDDGHKSLYSTAYPLLKKFNMKAVAYIVPGRVHENDEENKIYYRDKMCTWPQIREMHDSGVFDFQSHSMYHHSISITKQVVDFIRPGMDFSFLDSDLAPLLTDDNAPFRSASMLWGRPVLKWGARMGKRPAYIEDPRIAMFCAQHVAAHGHEAFFEQPGWRKTLVSLVQEMRSRYPEAGFESSSEQRSALLEDLRRSKEEIESRLPGKSVQHFCFPWFRGSPLAVELSLAAGYISNAWGSLLPGFVDEHDVHPIPIRRMPPKYIFRLPGHGRVPLSRVVTMSFADQMHHQPGLAARNG
ncbi:polysaccharide deacetylase family protein [Desulfovermiculus halophilus]|jgi:hypothetical protein|uniref:polysaccharide deacetylase family protein n=1 Tax=Desulfovermiculus halophilus TaxID=339722 RepID=UPI00129476FD|nr:polysaccharide deacetylase family protein [Desulfovermiculus halophilus]